MASKKATKMAVMGLFYLHNLILKNRGYFEGIAHKQNFGIGVSLNVIINLVNDS